jgi:ABC-2 type transport system permease protein
VAVALCVTVLSAVTVGLARRRDLGSGLVADRDRAPTRTRLLHSPLGLAVRTTRPVALGWLAGVVVVGLVFGLVAKSAALALQGSSSLHQALGRLGTGTGAAGYLGLAFLMVTVLVAVAAAGQVSATRDEEGLGHLEHLLVRPVRRVRWLAGRLVVATALIVLVGLAVGVAAWASSASQHSGVGFGPLLAAGANTVPPALVVLGAGTLVFGLAPRLAAAAAYAVVAWSFLVELVGSVVNANHWLLDTSLLHHVAAAPATGVRWSSAGILVLVAVAAAAAGAAAFDRRDLASA